MDRQVIPLTTPSTTSSTQANDIDDGTLARWKRFFVGISASDARQKIHAYRKVAHRYAISDAHWNTMRAVLEDQGLDREVYEFVLSGAKRSPLPELMREEIQDRRLECRRYLIKMEGPLSPRHGYAGPGWLALYPYNYAHAVECPGRKRSFWELDGVELGQLQETLGRNSTEPWPPCFGYSEAPKDLTCNSVYPALGVDATLPQARAPNSGVVPRPAQDEYPVWYFAHDYRAEGDYLAHLIGGPCERLPATLRGGLVTQRGEHKVLVDDPRGENIVRGLAILVHDKVQERTLRIHATERNEVVRCPIQLEGGVFVNGLTFRFRGELHAKEATRQLLAKNGYQMLD
ncbi:hypothetical protein ACJZ2D_002117 [Fusarium nematophilum]